MRNDQRISRKGKKVFVGLAMVAIFFLLVALVQFLWNNLMPEICGIKAVSYWQAFGLLLLSKILFSGGFCKKGPGFRKGFRKPDELDHEELSEEAREKLRVEWKRRFDNKCGF